ncbi:Late embryogenesis abundant protein [Melia azedarach]|uniref:Late embryogenesis abundant protein n=1 Tax=Melia azedarach TaxID=155640 RepID=A0ACC1X3K8_MELAZ|nr:Late embryogenesis abundant protein [Melia azedarach]
MAEQKIHPVHQDVESPPLPHTPTAPLVPPGASKSDKGDPAASSLEGYPPFRRTIPVTHSRPPKKKRSRLCKCFCWTISLILILIIVIAIVAGILYLVFRPKLPKFSVDKMQITQFVLNDNSSLEATFNVTITARNPNKKIGIYYESGSHISVYYTDTKLCEGSLPKFYQGHENTTVLNILLTGQTQNATELAGRLQEQQQSTGNVPLNLRVKQPVRVKLGKLKLMKVKFYVRCRVVVDRLIAEDNSIGFQSSNCKFRFRL